MSLKNWDNKTWLSSNNYIQSFNSFLLKQIKLDKNSQILDIGCGRGKILGNLSSILNLKNKPLGLDIEKHKDSDKRIFFEKNEGLKFLKRNKKKFDLILIKQTIHLFKINDIEKLLKLSIKSLNPKGKIFIFSLETKKNELPTFSKMKLKLNKSLLRDEKIFRLIFKQFKKKKLINFSFTVKLSKKKYLEMINNRYITTLLNFSKKELHLGLKEIDEKYDNLIQFNDKLKCIILRK